MKLNKLTKLCLLVGGLSSGNAMAWWCSDSITYTTIMQFQQEFTINTVGLGNLQKSLDFVEEAINRRLDLMDQMMQKQIDAATTNQDNAIKAAEQKIIDALQRFGTSQLTANNALAEHKVKRLTQKEINRIADKLEQPATNCMQYGMGQTIFESSNRMAKNSSAAALQTSLNALSVTDSNAVQRATYENLKNNYIQTNKPEMKDADVNASLAFGSSTGGYTRASTDEDSAVEAFKNHLIGEIYAPPRLDYQENTLSGQVYADLQRRYSTYQGLASKSANSVTEFTQANPDLVAFYEQSKLTPTQEQIQNGVSQSEVLNAYAEKILSGNALNTIASATEPTMLLRQLNQNTTMRLMVSFIEMKSNERVQAMEAAKLALLAEKVLGEQSSYLRQAAINQLSATGSEGSSSTGSGKINNVVDGTTGSSSSITVPNK